MGPLRNPLRNLHRSLQLSQPHRDRAAGAAALAISLSNLRLPITRR